MAEVNHGDRKHALLSPSGASRWMNCTPSARKEEHIPNRENDYAKEGTLAHELGELELRYYFKHVSKEQYLEQLKIIENNELYTDEMPEEVDKYVTYITNLFEEKSMEHNLISISIEDKIDLTEYIEDGYGANDFVITYGTTLEVVDLKYGRGVSVSALENPQLKLYGAGALLVHELISDITEVKLTIIQPRTNNYSSFIISVEDLKTWVENDVTEKAKIAFAGEGEFKAGDWCKFCKFKPQCRAVNDHSLAVAKVDFDISELTEEEILEAYERKEQIVSWLNSISEFVLNRLLEKKPISGYKLIEGRSNRKLKSPDLIKDKLLELKYNESDFMTEPKLLGITHLEKLVGKKQFSEVLGDFVYKDKGRPKVVPESENGNSYFSTAENDFL